MLLEANRLLCILERTHVVFKRISRLLHINCFSCLNSSVMKKTFCAKGDVMQLTSIYGLRKIPIILCKNKIQLCDYMTHLQVVFVGETRCDIKYTELQIEVHSETKIAHLL